MHQVIASILSINLSNLALKKLHKKSKVAGTLSTVENVGKSLRCVGCSKLCAALACAGPRPPPLSPSPSPGQHQPGPGSEQQTSWGLER